MRPRDSRGAVGSLSSTDGRQPEQSGAPLRSPGALHRGGTALPTSSNDCPYLFGHEASSDAADYGELLDASITALYERRYGHSPWVACTKGAGGQRQQGGIARIMVFQPRFPR